MTLPGLLAAPRRSRLRVGLGAAVVLLLLGLGIAVLVTATGSHGKTTALGAGSTAGSTSGPAGSGSTSTASSSAGGSPGATVYVHVVGAVLHPGLFPLRDGDRVVDAVAAAGGFADTADQTQVNLARFVTDGEQLAVPVIGAPVVAAPGAANGGAVPGAKVNLNTADLALLDTLPQVGPAMAKRILDWRTANGKFTSVEDLMSVTGVGDKTFEQLKDLVTI
jgi:competence protein ComEA